MKEATNFKFKSDRKQSFGYKLWKWKRVTCLWLDKKKYEIDGLMKFETLSIYKYNIFIKK
jgi:hypothetical protein